MTQSEWEPVSESVAQQLEQHILPWKERAQVERENSLRRSEAVHAFLERLCAKVPNTLEETKEIGWYLWNRERPTRNWQNLEYTGNREKYEERFSKTLEKWKQGRKSRRFGIAFLGRVCGIHKSTVSHILHDWTAAHKALNNDPEYLALEALSELGWGHGGRFVQVLPFDQDKEYVRIMETYTDLIEAGKEAMRLLEIKHDLRRRFERLKDRMRWNVVFYEEPPKRRISGSMPFLNYTVYEDHKARQLRPAFKLSKSKSE